MNYLESQKRFFAPLLKGNVKELNRNNELPINVFKTQFFSIIIPVLHYAGFTDIRLHEEKLIAADGIPKDIQGIAELSSVAIEFNKLPTSKMGAYDLKILATRKTKELTHVEFWEYVKSQSTPYFRFMCPPIKKD